MVSTYYKPAHGAVKKKGKKVNKRSIKTFKRSTDGLIK